MPDRTWTRSERFAEQLLAPLWWTETVSTLVELRVELSVEVGPHRVLSGLCRRMALHFAVASVEQPADIDGLALALTPSMSAAGP